MNNLDLEIDGLNPISLDNNTNNDDLFGIEMITNKKKQRSNSSDSFTEKKDTSNDNSGFFSNMFSKEEKNDERPKEVSIENILNSNDNSSSNDNSFSNDMKQFDFDNALNDIDLKNLDTTTPNVGEDMTGPSFPNLGNSTTSFNSSGRLNDDTDTSFEHHSTPKSLTYEEIQKEKFIYLNKLERLKDKGMKLPKIYSMASDLEEMKSDFNTLDNHRRMRNSIKFQRKILVSAISGIEKGNKYFNPMDIKLDGWSQDINDNINEYDDIFEELYEKYKEYIDTSPELKLLGAVATSGFMFHMNKSLASSVFDKISQSNPDLMQQFVNHTENTMKNQMNNSGGSFGNMMGDMMGRRNKHNNDEPTLYNPMDGPPFSNPQNPPPRNDEHMTDNVDELIKNLSM